MDTNFLLNKAIKLHLKSKIDQAEIIYKKIIKFDLQKGKNPDENSEQILINFSLFLCANLNGNL